MSSVRPFLSRIIDYAGLFPPAGLTMHETVTNYHRYRASQDRDLLGRLIIPIDRIEEFGEMAGPFLPREPDAEPWRLSVIATDYLPDSMQTLLEFNCSHWRESARGYATVDSVEIAARDESDIAEASAAFARSFEVFVEVGAAADSDRVIESISTAGVRAKIRTGGVTPERIPSATAIAGFIASCHRHGVKFKATAGLHHPIRGRYPLTYERDSDLAGMFGYLNVLVATAFVHSGSSASTLAGILEETDPAAFRFDERGVAWRSQSAATASMHAAREQLVMSFGSCSFDEPVSEARTLGFI